MIEVDIKEFNIEYYPHIAYNIHILWDSPRIKNYLMSLLINGDDRLNRVGLPDPIIHEIIFLSEISEIKFPSTKSVWN